MALFSFSIPLEPVRGETSHRDHPSPLPTSCPKTTLSIENKGKGSPRPRLPIPAPNRKRPSTRLDYRSQGTAEIPSYLIDNANSHIMSTDTTIYQVQAGNEYTVPLEDDDTRLSGSYIT
ncbi:hypothetical protein CMUS01_10230 [Colletotrichum musicola]|uniref:Uncharacterized protein n=1 Tax=Colletotrichum musicola TaxID=2175873 RepID=A0A8H6N8N8_9PEZI|nr:hypothetical protein CMUS01_10230 [Colletotrichum musicola]